MESDPPREALRNALAALQVPLDPESPWSVERRLAWLAERADNDLLEVGQFLGIALVALAAMAGEDEMRKAGDAWLASDERRRIEAYFRNLGASTLR